MPMYMFTSIGSTHCCDHACRQVQETMTTDQGQGAIYRSAFLGGRWDLPHGRCQRQQRGWQTLELLQLLRLLSDGRELAVNLG